LGKKCDILKIYDRKIDKRGRIYLPQKCLKYLNLDSGDRIKIIYQKGKIVLSEINSKETKQFYHKLEKKFKKETGMLIKIK